MPCFTLFFFSAPTDFSFLGLDFQMQDAKKSTSFSALYASRISGVNFSPEAPEWPGSPSP
jgi:hypothetical protein